ncbi:conserved hypothetical protein [Neospora caninum Liverpool]|uniref:Uncharacterized protein n=1 Tax=Neospora caninum (strain Liverpool) TaxID=572307 RepID=F0VG97_NEOCL|nr:conserved hypothetical protein [Neospora caninum Liverpool]CBZ52741.1 conserved hypothetical protein [Neospora caninum Liverpool]CEL66722.1 TPA: hypothetical protein BN1204_025290 [Neospora caninum Liverpool]|eukprot:XP_003882773.1 conserved hypothetical protein [Neospora caninum Liverpool]
MIAESDVARPSQSWGCEKAAVSSEKQREKQTHRESCRKAGALARSSDTDHFSRPSSSCDSPSSFSPSVADEMAFERRRERPRRPSGFEPRGTDRDGPGCRGPEENAERDARQPIASQPTENPEESAHASHWVFPVRPDWSYHFPEDVPELLQVVCSRINSRRAASEEGLPLPAAARGREERSSGASAPSQDTLPGDCLLAVVQRMVAEWAQRRLRKTQCEADKKGNFNPPPPRSSGPFPEGKNEAKRKDEEDAEERASLCALLAACRACPLSWTSEQGEPSFGAAAAGVCIHRRRPTPPEKRGPWLFDALLKEVMTQSDSGDNGKTLAHPESSKKRGTLNFSYSRPASTSALQDVDVHPDTAVSIVGRDADSAQGFSSEVPFSPPTSQIGTRSVETPKQLCWPAPPGSLATDASAPSFPAPHNPVRSAQTAVPSVHDPWNACPLSRVPSPNGAVCTPQGGAAASPGLPGVSPVAHSGKPQKLPAPRHAKTATSQRRHLPVPASSAHPPGLSRGSGREKAIESVVAADGGRNEAVGKEGKMDGAPTSRLAGGLGHQGGVGTASRETRGATASGDNVSGAGGTTGGSPFWPEEATKQAVRCALGGTVHEFVRLPDGFSVFFANGNYGAGRFNGFVHLSLPSASPSCPFVPGGYLLLEHARTWQMPAPLPLFFLRATPRNCRELAEALASPFWAPRHPVRHLVFRHRAHMTRFVQDMRQRKKKSPNGPQDGMAEPGGGASGRGGGPRLVKKGLGAEDLGATTSANGGLENALCGGREEGAKRGTGVRKKNDCFAKEKKEGRDKVESKATGFPGCPGEEGHVRSERREREESSQPAARGSFGALGRDQGGAEERDGEKFAPQLQKRFAGGAGRRREGANGRKGEACGKRLDVEKGEDRERSLKRETGKNQKEAEPFGDAGREDAFTRETGWFCADAKEHARLASTRKGTEGGALSFHPAFVAGPGPNFSPNSSTCPSSSLSPSEATLLGRAEFLTPKRGVFPPFPRSAFGHREANEEPGGRYNPCAGAHDLRSSFGKAGESLLPPFLDEKGALPLYRGRGSFGMKDQGAFYGGESFEDPVAAFAFSHDKPGLDLPGQGADPVSAGFPYPTQPAQFFADSPFAAAPATLASSASVSAFASPSAAFAVGSPHAEGPCVGLLSAAPPGGSRAEPGSAAPARLEKQPCGERDGPFPSSETSTSSSTPDAVAYHGLDIFPSDLQSRLALHARRPGFPAFRANGSLCHSEAAEPEAVRGSVSRDGVFSFFSSECGSGPGGVGGPVLLRGKGAQGRGRESQEEREGDTRLHDEVTSHLSLHGLEAAQASLPAQTVTLLDEAQRHQKLASIFEPLGHLLGAHESAGQRGESDLLFAHLFPDFPEKPDVLHETPQKVSGRPALNFKTFAPPRPFSDRGFP